MLLIDNYFLLNSVFRAIPVSGVIMNPSKTFYGGILILNLKEDY